jgi:YVTN family beta-propeller protein
VNNLPEASVKVSPAGVNPFGFYETRPVDCRAMVRMLTFFLLALIFAGCGDQSTAPASLIVVANRASESLSIIDPETDTVIRTVSLPAGAEPAIAGYVVYSPELDRIYVGDSANHRVVVLRAEDFGFVSSLPVPNDVFHMWLNDSLLWVVDRKDFSLAVFDLTTNTRRAVVPIPADLKALGGVPHDVVVDEDSAFVTIRSVDDFPDVVVKYNNNTLEEVGRASVGNDPHVFLHPSNRRLYVACQDTNNVFVLNRDTMIEETVVPILGGHGVWVPPHGRTLYVSNFPGHIVGGEPGPGADGRKLYVTHSNGDTKVTVFTLSSPTAAPEFLREIDVGDNPFGICRAR